MKGKRFYALLAAVLVCATPVAAGGPDRSVVVGSDEQPKCPNGFLDGCSDAWTSWTAGIALASIYIQRPNFTLVPYMGSAKVTSKKPFTLLVRINKNARWSDGPQVTSDDLIFTWKTIMQPQIRLAPRAAWDSIARAIKVNQKAVRFVFRAPYPGWKILLTAPVLPQHAFENQSVGAAWRSFSSGARALPASGPFEVRRNTKGRSIVLVRNPAYFGTKPALERVTIVPGSRPNGARAEIRTGASVGGPTLPRSWKTATIGRSGVRLDLNVRRGLLAKPWVRSAIADAIDRSTVLNTVSSAQPGAQPLNNALALPGGTVHLPPAWRGVSAGPAAAKNLLQENGCSPGADGIYECDGQRMSFGVFYDGGSRLQRLAADTLQAQLANVGIALRPQAAPASTPAAGHYDLFIVQSPATADPAEAVDMWSCGGAENFTGYCDPSVTHELEQSLTVPAGAANVLLSRADAALARDVPSIPLYSAPVVLAYDPRLHGAPASFARWSVPGTLQRQHVAQRSYNGAVRPGVYPASGNGSHIKLTVSGRGVEITYGTSFKIVCAGAVTRNFTGHSPDVRSVSFHPGFGFHPIDSRGRFRIVEHEKVLEGRFTGPATIVGTFHANAGGECRGDHDFTLRGAGGTIGPLDLPVLYDTYGHFLVKKALLPPGYDYEPSYGFAHPADPSRSGLSWNVVTGAWYDDATGKTVTDPIGRDSSKWGIGSTVYALMVKEALPSGYTLVAGAPHYRARGPGGTATWNDQTQEWQSDTSHAALSRSGLTFPYR